MTYDKFKTFKAINDANKLPHSDIKFILHDHTVILEPNVVRWALWFEKYDRRVGSSEFALPVEHWFWRLLGRKDNYWVSTVFLGVDHNFTSVEETEPLLFQTVIWKNYNQEVYQTRCSTWEQAEAMHSEAIAWVKQASEKI